MAVTTVRDIALAPSTDLAQAGAVFNDATRLLDGGLWSTPADSNNQIAYLGMYTTDIHAALNDINAMLASPASVTVGGAVLDLADEDTAVLTQVQGQLQTLITLANGSVGNSATAATNQELIHATQASILNEINGDATLAHGLAGATYEGGTGADNAGFQALPTGADDAASLAAASGPNATLAQIGNVFNAATDLAVGGLNHSNIGQFDNDMKAIAAGLTNLVNNPSAVAAIEQAAGLTGADAALTTVHLDTVLDQINLQINTLDKEYATNPNVAARSTNDNLLDIIDIVQGDAALNVAAGGKAIQEIPVAFLRCRPISKAPSRTSRMTRHRPISGPSSSPKATSSTTNSTPWATTRRPASCRRSSRKLRTIRSSAQRLITAKAASLVRASTTNCSEARSTPIPLTPSTACRAS